VIRVQREDFDLGQEYAAFADQDAGAGAIVAFVGRVRHMADPDQPKSDDNLIRSITLEHYPAMTQKELERIDREAQSRWPITSSLIIHRHGKLFPGDQIVLVLTASPHRDAAFEAAQFLMDWLKTKAPFWKEEETGASTRWVEAKEKDDDAAKRWK